MIKHASGMSPEELSLLDALQEGQRAGILGLAAGLNPYQANEPEFSEWERGRRNMTAAWLNHFKRA